MIPWHVARILIYTQIDPNRANRVVGIAGNCHQIWSLLWRKIHQNWKKSLQIILQKSVQMVSVGIDITWCEEFCLTGHDTCIVKGQSLILLLKCPQFWGRSCESLPVEAWSWQSSSHLRSSHCRRSCSSASHCCLDSMVWAKRSWGRRSPSWTPKLHWQFVILGKVHLTIPSSSRIRTCR